jgi:hypothetical protein
MISLKVEISGATHQPACRHTPEHPDIAYSAEIDQICGAEANAPTASHG